MAAASGTREDGTPRPKKRAIALGGGGPVAGFLIGALEALEHAGIEFDVWSLSCIGAWVGLHYNQAEGPNRAAKTYAFFKEHAFRDSASYEAFPINKAFAPDFGACAWAWTQHVWDPQTYRRVLDVSSELPSVAAAWVRFLTTPGVKKTGDLNVHLLNNVLAVNPFSRFMTSLAYRSAINGLSNLYYPDSSLLDELELHRLDLLDVPKIGLMDTDQLKALAAALDLHHLAPDRKALPEIYHNAWRLPDGERDPGATGRLQLFNNKWARYRQQGTRDYLPISGASLCACSALPYVEQTVRIPNDDHREYSEGALVDTVSFSNLIEDHPDLDEIWVCRIVDVKQLRSPQDLHDSLSNLCQQFAAEVGDNDVKLFRNHLRKSAGRIPRVIEIPLAVRSRITYRWDHDNLATGYNEGLESVGSLLEQHQDLRNPQTTARPWPVTAGC